MLLKDGRLGCVGFEKSMSSSGCRGADGAETVLLGGAIVVAWLGKRISSRLGITGSPLE